MIMLDTGMKSHLSAAYRDVSTKEEIYTYAYAINTDLYLFIDIYDEPRRRQRGIVVGKEIYYTGGDTPAFQSI